MGFADTDGTLVVLPVTSFFSTDLMTPTATVCRMSRTAKRPSGGYMVKGSTHMGLVGIIFTYAASPAEMKSTHSEMYSQWGKKHLVRAQVMEVKAFLFTAL